MEKAEFLKILKKYNTGNASEQENSYLAAYYNLFETDFEITEVLTPDETNSLKEQIKAGIRQKINSTEPTQASKTYTLFRRIAAVAIILLTLSAGIYVYEQWQNGYIYPAHYYAKHDLPPGSNKAILTLANGEKIILSGAGKGQVAVQGKTQVYITAGGQLVYNGSAAGKLNQTAPVNYNLITTPGGGQYQVILPDGSKVFLNAASSLHFPTAFAGNERKVELSGEAYFEIAHDKSKPFRVVTQGQTVEVLGTHFNINAYQDENSVKTTLLEGSVKVFAGHMTAIIKPGEQAQTDHRTAVINTVQNADTDMATAWKNGMFQFKDADLKTLMKDVSRWYNVDIEYEGAVSQRKFSGKIYRNISLAQLLEIINYSDIHFRIEKASGEQKKSKIIITP